MARSVKVNGVALDVIRSIKPGLEPQLVVHKLAKLRRMLRTEGVVWDALDEHDKKEIVEEAVEANGGSLVSTPRR